MTFKILFYVTCERKNPTSSTIFKKPLDFFQETKTKQASNKNNKEEKKNPPKKLKYLTVIIIIITRSRVIDDRGPS